MGTKRGPRLKTFNLPENLLRKINLLAAFRNDSNLSVVIEAINDYFRSDVVQAEVEEALNSILAEDV